MRFHFAKDVRARLLGLPALLRRGGGEEGLGSTVRGGRVEFREHRPYAPGDDPRDLDWSLFLRLGELHTKVYERREAPEVLVILDRSASMGPPLSGKDRIVREVAAGLVYAALAAAAPVTLSLAGEGGPVTVGRWRSARRLDAVLSLLEGLGDPTGPTPLAALRHLPPAGPSGRVTFLLSDFLLAPLPVEAVRALARGGDGGALLLVVAADEREPALGRPFTAADPETGRVLEIAPSPALRDAYRRELAAHEDAVLALGRRHGFPVHTVSDQAPFEAAVRRALLPEGRGP